VTYLDTLLRSQLGHPSGWFGSLVVVPFLNLTNRSLVNAAVELLATDPQHVVLDVGFGGGHSLWKMAGRVPHGKVIGVDYSRDMVEQAAQRIREKGLEARVQVEWGDVAHLPFRAGTFDRVLSINSLYYWPDLGSALAELARVLKRHGRLALGCHSPQTLWPFTREWEDFWLYEPQELAARMQEAGFHALRVEHRDRWQLFDTVVVVGERGAHHPTTHADIR
jgi:arsenite methyltransferase